MLIVTIALTADLHPSASDLGVAAGAAYANAALQVGAIVVTNQQ